MIALLSNGMKAVIEIINQYGFTHFLTPNRRKWIKDLPELISKAEQGGTVSQEKINNLRKTFELDSTDNSDKISVSIKPQEDKDN